MKKYSLKKAIFALGVAAIAAGAAVNASIGYNSGCLSDLELANIIALAQEEGGGGGGTLWIRTDGDCVYTVTGQAGATVTVFGISIKIGADGTATLTYNGSTDCESGGTKQCTAQYCPAPW
jgi:hypothetical protein